MLKTASFAPLTLAEAASSTPQQIVERFADCAQRIEALEHQLDWFKRQLFGQKSERRIMFDPAQQMSLGESLNVVPPDGPPPAQRLVAAHTRTSVRRTPDSDAEALPFFDAERVPVEVIELAHPETKDLAPDQYEVISKKESFRLAQRPGSYVVLKYVRPVIKHRDSGKLLCPEMPVGVIEGSRADVSFVAGLLLDKFAYHLPLYRQHQRLLDAGFKLSRPWLTQLAQQAAALLEPIYEAQFVSIRSARVKAMDETPIKAGRSGDGKMNTAYFWPVYGERDEICFPFFASRKAEHVQQALGLNPAAGAVLLSDGYGAYTHYTKKAGIQHAQCWAHCRRGFVEAQEAEPEAAAQALDFIGALYAVEEHIREHHVSGEKKRDYRLSAAKPVVERFFAWVNQQFERQGLLPKNPLTIALAYARERRNGLELYLTDPDVAIDTNHLERALRAIPMGRKAWLFSWTELGAKHVGILQSLIVTCRLHQVDPYDYLVDVLQRVVVHPAARVHELTPRLWKQLFASNPLRSVLHNR
jgi:transposase